MVKRSTVNFVIDLLTFLIFFAKVWTGLLIHYVLPPGRGRGHALALWGINRHGYGTVHFYLAVAMITLIIVHLWLHWSWICSTLSKLAGASRPKRIKRAIYGMILSLVMGIGTVGSLLWAKTQVEHAYGEDPGRYGYGRTLETSKLSHITGRTTLSQAAEMAGLSADRLISELQLPSNVNPNERLGRLGRQYGFEISSVRRILEQDK